MDIKKKIKEMLKKEGANAKFITLMKNGKNSGEWYCVYMEAEDGQAFCLMNDGTISITKINYEKEPTEQNDKFIILESDVIEDIMLLKELKNKLLRMMRENPPKEM